MGYVCLVAQSCPTLCNPVDSSLPGSSVHEDSPGKNTGLGCHALLQGNLPNPGIEPRYPALQVDSLPSEPSEKPKNTGGGSLSALQEDSLPAELPGKPQKYTTCAKTMDRSICQTQTLNIHYAIQYKKPMLK